MTSQTTRSQRASTNYLHQQHSSWTQFMIWGILFPNQRVTTSPLLFLFLKLCSVKFKTVRLFILVCANWRCIFAVQASRGFVSTSGLRYNATWPNICSSLWSSFDLFFLRFTFYLFVYILQSWKPRIFHHIQHYSSYIELKLIFCIKYYFQARSLMFNV